MKKALFLSVTAVLALCLPHVIFAQQKDIQGLWYQYSAGFLRLRFFTDDGRYVKANYGVRGSYTLRNQPFGTQKPDNYTVKDVGIVEAGGSKFQFRASPSVLLLWDSSIGEPAFYPVISQDVANLNGSWKIAGDTFDTELKIDGKNITFTKAKITRNLTYTSDGFPDLVLTENGKKLWSLYFFIGQNILLICIPGQDELIFQRIAG